MQANIEAFKKMLYSQRGYLRIESDYDPDTYQMGYLAEGIEFAPFNQSGAFETQFSIYFSCMPHKFYKANTSVSSPLYTQAITDITRIITRDSIEMQSIIQNIDVTSVPESDLYAVFTIDTYTEVTTPPVETVFSNFTATNQKGGFICVYIEYTNTTTGEKWYIPVRYAQGTIPSFSGTIVGKGKRAVLHVLIPVEIGMGLSINGTWEGSQWTLADNTAEFTNHTFQMANIDAFGASVAFEVKYSWISNSANVTARPCAFYVCSMVGDTVTNECAVDIRFDQMPSSFKTQLNSYMVNSMITVEITNDFRAYAVKGTARKNITDYLDVYGGLDYSCDTMKSIVMYISGTNVYGSPRQVTIKPEWWKL